MPSRSGSALAVLLLVCGSVLIGGVGPVTGTHQGYHISVEDSVDTPTRDVELEGATYEVSAIGKAATGESLNVSVQAPSPDQSYIVYLYNSDQQVIKGNGGTGDDTVQFDLTGLDAGTYMFTVQEQGANKKIHPLVIKGYETSLTAESDATVGDTVTIDVTTQQLRENVTTDRVEVVVAGQDTQIQRTATRDGSSYSVSISTDGFSEGTYSLYANVRGTETVYNQQIIYGVSDSHSLQLTDPSSTPSSGSSGVTTQADAPAASTATTTDGPTGEINTQIVDDSPTPTQTDATRSVSSEGTTPMAQTTAADTSSVVTPATGTPTSTPTTIPGFSIQITAITGAVAVSLLVARRHTS